MTNVLSCPERRNRMDRLFRWLGFNLWYFRRPPWDTRESPPELLEFIHSHPAGRALDIGCGTGTNLLTLAQAGWQCSGIDFAIIAIRAARQSFHSANMKANLQVNDVTHLGKMKGPFDLALDIGCYHGVPLSGRTAYRQALRQLLAPGGWYLLYANVDTERSSIALAETDVAEFCNFLKLVRREDGIDWGAGWHSAWFWFQAPEEK
jgi:SAM-dependent methyltransferase